MSIEQSKDANAISAEQQQFFQVLASVPEGKLVTYGQLALLSGMGKRARLAGRWLKFLPEGSKLPWHRVLNAQGKLSFPAGSEKYSEQKQRLAAEGVVMHNGKYSLKKYAWTI